MSERYITDPALRWIYPQDEPPPTGTKLALLTRGNVQVVGHWQDGGDYIAWQRLFKRDKTKEKGME